MSRERWKSESGQVMVILVFAVIGLLGMAALAIDGGMAYSDRRAAQNASDAAALAGAYARAHDPTANVIAAAEARATDNGFTTGDGRHTVDVYFPPTDGTYQGNTNYVQVKISSLVQTSLIQLIYKGPVVNRVESVAHFLPAIQEPLMSGNGLVALSPHNCSAINLGGSSQTMLLQGGILVNSDATGSGCTGGNAYAITGSGNFAVSSPSLTSVGAVDPAFKNLTDPNVDVTSVYQPAPALPYPPGISLVPPPDCGTASTASYNTATQTYSPGTTGGLTRIPAGTLVKNKDLKFDPGVYCIDASDFSFSGAVTIQADGVTFFVTGSNPCWWSWTGNPPNNIATLHLWGPGTSKAVGAGMDCNTSTYKTTAACKYKGIVIYVDPLNFASYPMPHTMDLAGNTGSDIDGTIYAPTCNVKYTGTQGFNILGQVIGYSFQNAGTNNLSIVFNANDAGVGITPAYLDLAK